MTRFIVMLALLWCSGTKPAIFPRYARTISSLNSTSSLASIHLHILFFPPEPTLIHHSDVRTQVKFLTLPPLSPHTIKSKLLTTDTITEATEFSGTFEKRGKKTGFKIQGR